MRRRIALPFTLVAAAVGAALTGCSDAGPVLAPSSARISIADGMLAQRAALDWVASVVGVADAVDPDTVTSLTVEITGVAFLPVGEDENDEGGWQPLTLDEAVSLDLMTLPTEQEGSIEIAAGSVPVGSYRKVRLLVAGGEIVFDGELMLGGAVTFDGGTPYAVTVPSGAQTGLKIDVAFDVTAGEDESANAAFLVFEPGTTFQNVSVQGTSGVSLAPVLRAR